LPSLRCHLAKDRLMQLASCACYFSSFPNLQYPVALSLLLSVRQDFVEYPPPFKPPRGGNVLRFFLPCLRSFLRRIFTASSQSSPINQSLLQIKLYFPLSIASLPNSTTHAFFEHCFREPDLTPFFPRPFSNLKPFTGSGSPLSYGTPCRIPFPPADALDPF